MSSSPLRLFHFSDDPAITRFVPRPVAVPSARPAGCEWLNGPLVWAVDAWHAPMYLFPRECPRVLVWCVEKTTRADREPWFGGTSARMIAHVEQRWWARLSTGTIHRYELPATKFTGLDDAGMYVSREVVVPLAVETVPDLPAALRADGVDLRMIESLTSVLPVFATTLHASGIRLRNAGGAVQ